MIDFEATLLKVRSQTPPLPDEIDSQYEARTLHLCYMLLEHEPSNAIMKPVEEKEENGL